MGKSISSSLSSNDDDKNITTKKTMNIKEEEQRHPQHPEESDSTRSFIFEDDYSNSDQRKQNIPSAKALSMAFMKSLSGLGCCPECRSKPEKDDDDNHPHSPHSQTPSALYNLQAFQRQGSSISPLVAAPMSLIPENNSWVEGILGEYMTLCLFYKVPYNPGILTTLRFSLPSLRVTGSFHDADMLALT